MQETRTSQSQVAPETKTRRADSVNFDRAALLTKCRLRLQASFGLPETNAERFAAACVEEMAGMYAGARIYITKRAIDREAIRREFREGTSIASLARVHGLTARSIRRIVIR